MGGHNPAPFLPISKKVSCSETGVDPFSSWVQDNRVFEPGTSGCFGEEGGVLYLKEDFDKNFSFEGSKNKTVLLYQ